MTGSTALRAALSGPWALTWQAWAVLALPSVLLTVNTFAHEGGVGLAVAAGCANALALGVGMAAARLTFTRIRPSLARMLVAYFLIGVLRAVPVAIIQHVDWDPLGAMPSAWSLMAFSGMFAVVWLSLLAVLLSELAAQRQSQARLRFALAQGQRAHVEADRVLATVREQVREQLERNVIPVIEDVLARIRSMDATAGRVEILQQAQRLRELAGRDVRELGRDLLGPTAQLPAAAVRTPTARSVLRRALQGSRIRGGLTLSISLLMSISLAIAWGGPWAGLALTAATLAAMAWLGVVEHALLRNKATPWGLTAASWAIAMVLYASILSTAYPARGLQLSVLTIGGWCLAYLTLALVDGLIDMNRARTIELAQREAEVRQASHRTWQQAQSERGRLGRLLHGPVQGRLAATSLALRAYEQGQGDISLEDCASQLERTLAALVELDAEPAPATLDLALAQVRADWAGLMNVTFEVTGGDLVGTQFDGEPIMQAAIECLSNAARHAGARHAHVLIKATDEGVWLTVRDDGSGPAEAVRDGIRDGMRDGAGWAGIRATGASVRLHRNSEATLVRAWWPSEVISPPARRSAPPPAHLEPAAAPAGLAP